MEKADITVVGAGVVGLAVAYYLSSLPDRDVVVLEKNSSFGLEASSRNSEVIHASLYYPPGSKKAKTCLRGRELLYELCSHHSIAFKKTGKLIVASERHEFSELERIYENAIECGITDLRFLEAKEINRLEPEITGERALFSPDSGIVDSHALMKFLYASAKEKNTDFVFSNEVKDVKKVNSSYELSVKEPNGNLFSFRSEAVINCSGLNSDRIAEALGIDIRNSGYKISYCKGQYFRIRKPDKVSISHLIYPLPSGPGLGIHLTPDLGGNIRVGPDAKYVQKIDYDIHENDRVRFCDAIKKFLPWVHPRDLIPDTAGIRAKLSAEGEGFRDFMIRNETDRGFSNFINVIGIDSPGLTSSLAIAEIVAGMIEV